MTYVCGAQHPFTLRAVSDCDSGEDEGCCEGVGVGVGGALFGLVLLVLVFNGGCWFCHCRVSVVLGVCTV